VVEPNQINASGPKEAAIDFEHPDDHEWRVGKD